MRIAQVAPLVERVPPKKYGGTERVVSVLTEELVRRGHEVTLFATGDSITSAKLVSVYPRSLREAKFSDLYGLNQMALANIGLAYARAGEFDVIHDHNGYISLPVAEISPTPAIITEHGPFNTQKHKIYELLRRPPIVSISESQIAVAPYVNHLATVYNGLTMEHYPYSGEHDGYLLFVGRISMEKGTHLAIEVAQYLDIPLIIAGKVDPIDQDYYRHYVAPLISDAQVRWIGEVDEAERNRLMSRAMAFLHPVTWREPFGLTMIEAMACGAPVIAFRRGSVSEIVRHGETGYVVDSMEEMIEAVLNIAAIDRAHCQKHALQRFSAARMADGYEAAYKKAVEAA